MSTIVLDRAAVRVAVDGRPAPKTLLEELTLRLTEQRIGVIGANGSGKSTLLRLLNGLVAPSSGTVTVDGSDTVRAVREVRRRVGFVFTDPLSQLVMPTGREDVELSLRRSVRNARRTQPPGGGNPGPLRAAAAGRPEHLRAFRRGTAAAGPRGGPRRGPGSAGPGRTVHPAGPAQQGTAPADPGRAQPAGHPLHARPGTGAGPGPGPRGRRRARWCSTAARPPPSRTTASSARRFPRPPAEGWKSRARSSGERPRIPAGQLRARELPAAPRTAVAEVPAGPRLRHGVVPDCGLGRGGRRSWC